MDRKAGTDTELWYVGEDVRVRVCGGVGEEASDLYVQVRQHLLLPLPSNQLHTISTYINTQL